MSDFIDEVRSVSGFTDAVLNSVVLEKKSGRATLNLITDRTYTESDMQSVKKIAEKYVPSPFSCQLEVVKITPDCDMVKRKVLAFAGETSKIAQSMLKESDVTVQKTQNGFYFKVALSVVTPTPEMAQGIITKLKKTFCGEFNGECVKSEIAPEDIEIEETGENIEYVVPVRTFEICNYKPIESTERPKTAVYISDLNFESESVSICGTLEHKEERTYKRKDGTEKPFFVFTVNDGTASTRVTCFARLKNLERLRALQEGVGIVCTGKTETYNGNIRFTSSFIDLGTPPENFKPEKRPSKPAPRYYACVKPQPYEDFSQTDMFAQGGVPDCLKKEVFVVLDLETTGRNTSPSSGNMDSIIEIGACKIIDGAIRESFSTLVNPGRKLSEEIVTLTGINDSMLVGAPTYEQAMPDFFKFCNGAYLVGHNIAGFDFKFIDYYFSRLGYVIDRKIFDTLPFAQEMLFLKNYKLNTIADHFGFSFNHHRALDDAAVTAKIFIELVKLKKSLPKLC